MLNPDAREMVHVAAACDENYCLPLAAMLASLASRLDPRHELTVHVLASGFGTNTWRKLRDSVSGARVRWNCIDVEASTLMSSGFSPRAYEHISAVCFFRLLLPELLPAELDKVLYLDCDLVVRADVAGLWRTDIRDVAMAAVSEWDRHAGRASSPGGIPLYRQLGLHPDQRLFNSGVLLVNLRHWRIARVAERAFNYLRVAGGDVRWYEQEALNVICDGKYRELEPRWNVPVGNDTGVDSGGIAILHYLSASKPWHWHYDAMQAVPFFAALDRTQWAGWRPRRPRFGAALLITARLSKAIRKRAHRARTFCAKRVARLRYGRARPSLGRVDGNRRPPETARELRLFLASPLSDGTAFRQLLEAWFAAGVERVVILCDNAGSAAPIPQCFASCVHVFTCAHDTAEPALRHLLEQFGRSHCCVLSRGSELLADGTGVVANLHDLRAEMDAGGVGVVEALYEEGEPVELAARDARSGRIFRSAAYTVRPAHSYEPPRFVSRVAVLNFSGELLLNAAATLCGGMRRSATLLHVKDPGARAASEGGPPA